MGEETLSQQCRNSKGWQRAAILCTFIVLSFIIIAQQPTSNEYDHHLEELREQVQTLTGQISNLTNRNLQLQLSLTQNEEKMKNQIGKLNEKIEAIEKSYKEFGEYQQQLNIKLGYVNEEISNLRMQTSRPGHDHPHPHGHHGHHSHHHGQQHANRRHF